MLQDENSTSREHLEHMWRHVYDIVKTAAEACGVADLSLNDETIQFIDGEPSFLFNQGVPPMSCNALLLALGHGAVSLMKGTVDFLYEHGAVVKGQTIEADIVVACFGFTCDEELLKGHYLLDSWFIDVKKSFFFFFFKFFFF